MPSRTSTGSRPTGGPDSGSLELAAARCRLFAVTGNATLRERMIDIAEEALEDTTTSLVRRLGLGADDVPQLRELVRAWPELADADGALAWLGLLACRALAELGDPAAVTELLGVLDALDEMGDVTAAEELPHLARELGGAAFEPLLAYAGDASRRELSRIAAIEGLERLTAEDAHRERVIALLVAIVRAASPETASLAGFAIGSLIELRAVEHAETMRAAFATGFVDEQISGGWDRVAWKLGIGPKPTREDEDPSLPAEADRGGRVLRDAKAKKDNKAARKRQKAARKKTRR